MKVFCRLFTSHTQMAYYRMYSGRLLGCSVWVLGLATVPPGGHVPEWAMMSSTIGPTLDESLGWQVVLGPPFPNKQAWGATSTEEAVGTSETSTLRSL